MIDGALNRVCTAPTFKTSKESKEALEDKVPAKDKVPDGC